MKLVSKVQSVFDHMLYGMVVVACIILAVSLLIVNAEVIMRYGLNSPIPWGLEVCEFGLVFITALSVAWLLTEEGHVKVDFVLDQLKPKFRALLNTITSALSAIVLLLIVWYGLSDSLFLLQTYITQSGAREYGNLRLPRVYLVFPFAIGLFLFCIQFVRRAYSFWKLWRRGGKIQEEQILDGG